VHERARVDAIVLEPSCAVARSVLRRFRRRIPPVICLSIYPRESVDAPAETVAYLLKPTSSAKLGAALAGLACA
jgi:superfamily II DNA or RNA helicase